ncbi:MAG: TonB-dependent receptor [Gammaproteobacteria bacterium]|nr:TonB-dependent receptor [Gammaproteobacteria bacterium]
MRTLTSRAVLAAISLALLPIGAIQTPAAAQEAVLEEIIVTARKREESLFDIPVAITAITGEQIENFGLTDLQDVAKIVPGLTFDRSVTQNDYAPALRGLQAEQGRNSVGLLIDDIDISSQNVQVAGGGSLARLRLVDVERIEVVKGPQAALYGRSAFGGAVNYITKRPSLDEYDLKAALEAHSESGQEVRVSAGAPVVEDAFGVRVNAYWFDERGSYRNTVSDDYVGGGDGMGISAAFLLQANENLSVYGRLEYSDESYAPQAAFVINGNTDVNLTGGAEIVLNRATTRIFSGPLVDGPIGFDINHRTGEDYKGMDVEYFRATVISDWDAGSFGLKSLTSWVESNDDIFQDNDFVSGSVNGVVTGAFQETERINDTTQFSQEVRIYSQTDSRLQWLLGALYWKEDVDQFGSNDTGLALGPILDSDVHAFYDTRDGEGRNVSRYTDHQSVFAWSEYALTEQLFVSAEVRYTDEEIQHMLDFDPPFNFFFGVISLGGVAPPILSSFGMVTGIHSETITEKYTIPRVALSYRPNDNLNLYGAIGKGVKPSGFQDGAVFSLDRPFDRESLWSYEVGAKALLMGGALAVNAAAFFQDYTDQQVSSQIFNEEAQQLQPVIENAGKSTIWGLEFEANWRATEELTLSGAYTYINGEFDNFRVVSTSASRIGESGCGEFLDFARPACLLIKDGNRPADLPEHQLNFNGNYTASLNANWDWFADLSARHTSERFVSSANVATQDAYWRVDGQLGVRSESMRAALYVDNLLDDDTVTDGNLYVDFFNGFAPSGFGYRPIPRMVGLRVSYSM